MNLLFYFANLKSSQINLSFNKYLYIYICTKCNPWYFRQNVVKTVTTSCTIRSTGRRIDGGGECRGGGKLQDRG